MKNRDSFRNLLRYGFVLAVWGSLSAVWAVVWASQYAEAIALPFYRRGDWLVVAVYAFLLLLFNRFYGGFRIGYHKRGDVIYSGILAMVICNVITYLQTSLLGLGFMDARPMLVMSAVQMLVIVVWAMVAYGVYYRVFSPRELLMVYGGEERADSLRAKMATYPDNFIVKRTLDVACGYEEACREIVKYRGVIICDVPAEIRSGLLKFCFERGIRTYTVPKISDVLLRGATDISLFDTPLLLNRNRGLPVEQRFAKRLTDVVLSGVGLVLALPFMVLIAVAVKGVDRGRVFYTQQRLTRGGRVFTLYKFRSMVADAEALNGARLAAQNDPRITPVGRFLRKVRLDELPQLWNILKGDMSLVGPRPERPEIAAQLRQTMPEFDYRLRVKAGLTGLAQTVGRYNTSAYDKLMLDLAYIADYSYFKDFKLIMATVKILFEGDRTEGVKGENT